MLRLCYLSILLLAACSATLPSLRAPVVPSLERGMADKPLAPAAALPAAAAEPLAAYVVLTAEGHAQARVILAAGACPPLQVDGASVPSLARVEPATPAQRPGQALASVFPERICALDLPASAREVRLGERTLPLPAPQIRRVVVVGDTGCRIKQSEAAYQDCSSAQAWPFASVARAAAGERPDLVVHVGDYHYRETPCPAQLGCASSPYGYGWDAWNADFFSPAASLLAVAPWVFARGNHEECARAGQEWFRALDPGAYSPVRSCNDPALDNEANVSPPYAVPLGDGWQLVVFDSARASRPLDPARPADARILQAYGEQMRQASALAARPGVQTLFVNHHPILGFALEHDEAVHFGNAGLLNALHAVNGDALFPAGVAATLHGHVHAFEAVHFASDHPVALVSGHGGDKLDPELPDTLPARYDQAPGVVLDFAAHGRGFGYLVMDRSDAGWTLRAQALDGSVIARCTLLGRDLQCAQGAISHPAPMAP